MADHLPTADDLIHRTPGDWTAEPAPPPRVPGRRRRIIKRVLLALFALFALLVAWLAVTAPLSKSLKPLAPPTITLRASDGSAIARKGAIIDRPVSAARLPDHVREAFIAIEDRRFYSHLGIDPRGLARAAWHNLTSSSTQGGSTITQQLAKMTFLTADRKLTRKAREMLIAFWLEAWLTKDQILERYLSNAYFGDNVYGLRAASLHYFSRQPEKLTLPQAAMLAGLVQAPTRLAPTRNLSGARRRQRLVLLSMADAGFISPATANATSGATLKVLPPPKTPSGTYFADWALPQARAAAEDAYGETDVETTLDARLQRYANQAVSRGAVGGAQVALVAMRPTGEVVAMVGGRSYKASPFNRATQARRQPGSTFKLFVYLAALRAGMTPDSLVDDSAITEGGYRPKNSGGSYRGRISLEQAFAKSSNVAAVRLYREVGGAAVIQAARDLGIRSPLEDDPTLALGSSGVTLLELTSAYAAIAANRAPVTPRALPSEAPGIFDRVMALRGRLNGRVRDDMLELLRAPLTSGTGRSAALAIDAYGKTGTSQDNRDALFVGFAGDLVVGVWVGRDDNKPLGGVHGGGAPARIWRDFMSRALPGARPAAPPPVLANESDAELLVENTLDGLLDNSSVTIDPAEGAIEGSIGDVPVRVDRDGIVLGRREDEPAEPEPAEPR